MITMFKRTFGVFAVLMTTLMFSAVTAPTALADCVAGGVCSDVDGGELPIGTKVTIKNQSGVDVVLVLCANGVPVAAGPLAAGEAACFTVPNDPSLVGAVIELKVLVGGREAGRIKWVISH